MDCPHGLNHPAFVLTRLPLGIISLEVCWDSITVREIAKELRRVAAELDELPEDHQAGGVVPL